MDADGGSFTSKDAQGHPLATAIVPPGAFTGSVILSLKSGDPAQTAPVPEGITAAPGSLNFSVSSPSQKEIELIIPAPAEWTLTDPARVFWMVGTGRWGRVYNL